jgi:hypothetical protein
MKKIYKTTSLYIYRIMAIVFIIFVCYGLYHLIFLLISKIDKIDANMFSIIVGGFVAITGYFITRHFERKKESEQKIREQKIPVYERFIDFYFEKFREIKKNRGFIKSEENNELMDFFWDMKRKSILWLSDDTFHAYLNWEKQYREELRLLKKSGENYDNDKLVAYYLRFTDVLLEFRKDIGHKNRNIKSEDISSLIISDFKDVLKENKN